MKILYLVSGIGPPAGWGTEFIQDLIFELSKKNIKATIINPIYKHTHPQWREWTRKQEKQYGVRIISLQSPAFVKKSLLLHFALTPFFVTFFTVKLLFKEKFDLIHEFSSTPIILIRSLVIKLLFGIPTIFTLSVYNNTLLGKFFWFKLFNFSQMYCIPSQEIIDNLKNLGIQSRKISFVPPTIDAGRFRKVPKKSVAREKLGLPKDKKIISFFGSLTEEKGISDLLDAVRKIDTGLKEILLVAIFSVWKGSRRHNVWINKLKKIAKHIKVLEGQTDIPLVIAASDAIILPQRTGHGTTIPPISILEVLASKTPLITTDILNNRELVKPPDILLPPKNSDVLSKAIEKILKVKPKIRPRNINLNSYSIENVTNAYLKIYRSATK